MNERIKKLIEYYGFSVRAFEQKISVSEGTIYRGLSRNSDFGSSILEKILNYCSDVSPEWLLLGKGEMLRSGSPKPASSTPADNDLVLKILAEKDRRIEQLILEKHELEQRLDTVLRVSADIQSVTPPQSAGTQIDTASNA